MFDSPRGHHHHLLVQPFRAAAVSGTEEPGRKQHHRIVHLVGSQTQAGQPRRRSPQFATDHLSTDLELSLETPYSELREKVAPDHGLHRPPGRLKMQSMPLQLAPGRYLGETRGHQVVAGLIVTETLHRFPSRLPLHTHTAPYFCLVLSGAFDERVGATLCEARPGDLLFHPPGETHTDEIRAAGTLVFNIVLGGSWVGLLGQLEPCRRPRPGRQNAAVARVAGRIARELAAHDSISDFAIQGLVHTFSRRRTTRAPLRAGAHRAGSPQRGSSSAHTSGPASITRRSLASREFMRLTWRVRFTRTWAVR